MRIQASVVQLLVLENERPPGTRPSDVIERKQVTLAVHDKAPRTLLIEALVLLGVKEACSLFQTFHDLLVLLAHLGRERRAVGLQRNTQEPDGSKNVLAGAGRHHEAILEPDCCLAFSEGAEE